MYHNSVQFVERCDDNTKVYCSSLYGTFFSFEKSKDLLQTLQTQSQIYRNHQYHDNTSFAFCITINR